MGGCSGGIAMRSGAPGGHGFTHWNGRRQIMIWLAVVMVLACGAVGVAMTMAGTFQTEITQGVALIAFAAAAAVLLVYLEAGLAGSPGLGTCHCGERSSVELGPTSPASSGTIAR